MISAGINGLGRIGRALCRICPDFASIKKMNSLSDIKHLSHLLNYDSVHGKSENLFTHTKDEIHFKNQKASYTQNRNIEKDMWNGLDLVLECSGVFKKRQDLLKHIELGGAKKVLLSAPSKEADLTLVYGVNESDYDPKKHHIISNASCTTNCLAPMIKVLHENFKVSYAFFNTIHSYTNDQNILDNSHKKDLRRARTAGLSMIPTSTGASENIQKIFPDLKNKVSGIAVRVPTANVSLVDLSVQLEKKTSLSEIHEAFEKAENSYLKNILRLEKNPLVSCDFNGDQSSSIIDPSLSLSLGENFFKIFSWYDNEMAFSQRMWDMSFKMFES